MKSLPALDSNSFTVAQCVLHQQDFFSAVTLLPFYMHDGVRRLQSSLSCAVLRAITHSWLHSLFPKVIVDLESGTLVIVNITYYIYAILLLQYIPCT